MTDVTFFFLFVIFEYLFVMVFPTIPIVAFLVFMFCLYLILMNNSMHLLNIWKWGLRKIEAIK
nr:MAG TPA: hypothetical protein [Caudoviricetes sp.]